MITFNTYYHSKKELTLFVKKNDLEDDKKLLIQIFTSSTNYSWLKSLLQEIKEIIPLATIIGTTTDGEIMNANVSEYTTVLSFTKFERIVPKSIIVNHENSSFTTGATIANSLLQYDSRLMISFADGLNTNGDEYLKGIDSYAPNIIVAGGLAADQASFSETFVFTEQGITSNGAVAVALNGPKLKIFTQYSFNWQPIGKAMFITSVKNNRVYTIDNKTTKDTYAHYLGEHVATKLPKTAIEFPLIIERNGLKIARAVISCKDDGSFVFAGDLQVGDRVRFGYGNAKEIMETSKKQQESLNSKSIESIFVYSCMARRRLMPFDIDREIKPLLQYAPVAGFFSYGEFFSNETKTLLNQTMTLLAISETENKGSISSNNSNKYFEHNEEFETLKAFVHLVNVTSQELDDLNNSLLINIEKEVQKNRDREKAMFQQSRLAQMGEMISMIAHQWRQPLSAISATVANLNIKIMMDKLEKDNLQSQLNNIEEYSQHLSKTIDDFRGFYKSNKKKQNCTLEAIFESALNIIETSIHTKNIKIERIYTCNIEISTYPNDLKQVILNLIKNAEDALVENKPDSPIITLRTDKYDNYVYLEVSDNAGGIAPEMINRLFDPYFTTKQNKDGTGLGLYMSKMIVDKHCAGVLKVHNSSVGAIFSIELPISPKE